MYGAATPPGDDPKDLVRLGVLAHEISGQVDAERLELLKMGQFFVLELLLGLKDR